jgi:hypothetical protein
MAPSPANKLSRIRVPVLFKGELPESSCPDVEITGPHHAVPTVTHFRTGKHGRIAQRPEPLEDALASITDSNSER